MTVLYTKVDFKIKKYYLKMKINDKTELFCQVESAGIKSMEIVDNSSWHPL